MESSERATQCLSALMKFAIHQKKITRMHIPKREGEKRPVLKALFKEALDEKRANLLETESRNLLEEYGISLPEAVLARNSEEAREAADRISYPLAMKVVCPDIIHKSDAGGIRLDLKDEKDVEKAFKEILENVCKVTSKERVLGTLVSPMAAKGQECILGMIRNPQFGPVIMFGLGGIFVEVLRDISLRVAPLTVEDMDEMIREIKGYEILTGIRGERPKDIEAIKDILGKLSEIAIDNPEIEEIDLNPVIVHEKGASIVDSRVILDL